MSNKGGKRPGAGRPPGGSLPVVHPQELDGLDVSERERTFAAYKAVGLSTAEACRRIGVSSRTGYTWEHADYFPVIVETARQKIIGNPRFVYGPRLTRALEVLDEILVEAPQNLQYAAAKDVLEQLMGKAVVRTISDSRATIDININVNQEDLSQWGEYIDM